MKLFRVVLKNEGDLPVSIYRNLIKELFKKSDDEVSSILMELEVDGSTILAELPFQFAEQKVAEIDYLGTFDGIEIPCYYEEVVKN